MRSLNISKPRRATHRPPYKAFVEPMYRRSGFPGGNSDERVTELAYLDDLAAAYVRTFRAHVTALPPGGVVLDRTYFYPVGGGQPADHGTLRAGADRTFEVVDVTKSGAAAIHRIRSGVAPDRGLTIGVEVEGAIDWDRRYRHMRLHTAQHLLSARIFSRTGVRTRRALLRGSSATVDLEAGVPSTLLEPLAADLHEAVEHPRPVSIRRIPRTEWDAHPAAGRSGLVPLSAQVDPVRVVLIEEWDACPCGGTHVRSTGEIGAVSLLPLVPLPDGAVRVAFTLTDAARATPPA
jgi:misacylated tRNA(Ala) deacylase